MSRKVRRVQRRIPPRVITRRFGDRTNQWRTVAAMTPGVRRVILALFATRPAAGWTTEKDDDRKILAKLNREDVAAYRRWLDDRIRALLDGSSGRTR